MAKKEARPTFEPRVGKKLTCSISGANDRQNSGRRNNAVPPRLPPQTVDGPNIRRANTNALRPDTNIPRSTCTQDKQPQEARRHKPAEEAAEPHNNRKRDQLRIQRRRAVQQTPRCPLVREERVVWFSCSFLLALRSANTMPFRKLLLNEELQSRAGG